MHRGFILIAITVLALLASVAIVVAKKVPPDELQLLLSKGVIPHSLFRRQAPVKPARQQADKNGAPTVEAQPVERTDEELQSLLQKIPVLKEIPWETNEVQQMFSNRTARPCQLLPQETPIEPMEISGQEQREKLLSQRTTAFLVGLRMDARARNSLPSLSKATIESYLAQNQLGIQAEVCRDRSGRHFFTGAVHAAFFAKSRPSLTGTPEPMIADAVKSFRVLGVLPPEQAVTGAAESSPASALLPRTLVLAFSYVRDKQMESGLVGGSAQEYELIFLHLLPENALSVGPEFAVFTTTDGGAVLQELNLQGQRASSGDAAVMASIRFEDFKLMGLYPANPVVTGLTNKIRGSVGVEEFRHRLNRAAGGTASLEVLLEELHFGPEFSTMTSKAVPE